MIEDLAPWEAASLFDTPLQGTVTVVAPTVSQLVGADGKRYCLIVSIVPPATGQCQISVNPNMGTAEGIVININQGPLIIDLRDWGPLVQMAWFASNTNPGSSVLQFYSLSVLRWPRDTRRSLILPWDEDAASLSARTERDTKQRIARLRQLLGQCGVVSPRWQSNGY